METIASRSDTDHRVELKRAMLYLHPRFDSKILFKLLKTTYEDEEARDLSFKWYSRSTVKIKVDFDTFYNSIDPFPLSHKKLYEHYLNELYLDASSCGYDSTGFKSGKKQPSKKVMKEQAANTRSQEKLEQDLIRIQQNNLSTEQKSYLEKGIINLEGSLYFRDFILKKYIPDDPKELKKLLIKLLNCEIFVQEGIELINERPGRETDEMDFRYKVRLQSPERVVEAEISADELTTQTKFSRFLVSKGFMPFNGKREHFNLIQKFIIQDQEYPISRTLPNWGEIEPGVFLFRNGIYDANEIKFYPADSEYRINYKGKLIVCSNGSKQVQPPEFKPANETTQNTLADRFYLWEQFNGMVNVRASICYGICCLFSSEILKRYKGFPLLFIFGEQGTGKSTSADWFMALFGYSDGNRQSVSKINTIKSVVRRMSIPKSFPFFLDDFRHHESNKNVPDLTSSILNWYHRIGTGMAKMSMDNRTIDTPMNSSVVMTGNEKPTDPAVLDRLLILNYTKYLNREEQKQLKLITDNVGSFVEFLSLILVHYTAIKIAFFDSIEIYREKLANEGFQARTCLNWSFILAAHDTFQYFFPGLERWIETQDNFYNEVVRSIKKEQSLQNELSPVLAFFSAMDYYASDIVGTAGTSKYHVLDDRHFIIKRNAIIHNEASKSQIGSRDVLAIHLNKIWATMQSRQAAITREIKLPVLQAALQNSKYYLSKGEQTFLTREVGSKKQGNFRCFYLDLEILKERGQLSEVIDYARQYEAGEY